MVKMDREQMLEYLRKFDGKELGKYSEEQVKATVKKMEELLKKFGFEFHQSFSVRCNDYSSKKKDTSWFWRFKTGEYDYIEVQTGYIKRPDKKYGSGRNAKYYPQPIEGIFRVHNYKADLNPDTGKPWQIGDIKQVSPYYSVTLTKRGWYSGD